jgi:hypothetical protein
MSSMFEKCHDWLVDNKLSLHLGKTESILFGPQRKLKSIDNSSFSIECKGIKIDCKPCVKYLRIILDNVLCGEQIVDVIIKKANQRLNFLCRHK